jgi:hypothetical protein
LVPDVGGFMGMFDYVHYETECPTCGTILKEFQSKDRECCFDKLEPCHVSSFYTACKKCNTWIEYKRKGNDSVRVSLEDGVALIRLMLIYFESQYGDEEFKRHLTSDLKDFLVRHDDRNDISEFDRIFYQMNPLRSEND